MILTWETILMYEYSQANIILYVFDSYAIQLYTKVD